MGREYTGVGTAAALAARLEADAPLLLDGATGTELERRGVHCGLPLWSTHALLDARDVLREVHRAYVDAGAEVITANTFRTQRRTLARSGLGDLARQLTAQAVLLARDAQAKFVAGSAPPLEDCYRPDWSPDFETAHREHSEHAEHLAAAGVDLILVETMNCTREAAAAARAASQTGLPFWVSFVAWRDGCILSGEPLERAMEAVIPFGPSALLVNCLPATAVDACLPALTSSGLPFGVYANLGEPREDGSFESHEATTPAAFAQHAARWADAGARILGGCCGTTPAHIAELAAH